jgi:hypothetical protein
VEKFCPGKQLLAFKEGLLHRVTVISLANSTQRLIGYSTVTSHHHHHHHVHEELGVFSVP